jgi:NTP pyrophosphatase (non-canonical NTP hydrolase)
MQKNEAQIERLALLSEELGEAVQIVGKILRHGIESTDPNGNTNKNLLEKELGDILAALFLMRYNNDLDLENIETATLLKMKKYKSGEAYLHHQVFRNDWPKTL